MRRHAETARSDLLDLGHLDRAIARRVFAAFARVRARAQPVHAFGQRLVRFRAQGTQRHAGRIETLEDGFDRFDFRQRNLPGRINAQIHQVTQHRHRTLVHELGVLAVLGVIAALHRLLQLHHHIRVVGVVFLAVHVLQEATLLNRAHRVERKLVQLLLVGFEIGKIRPGNARDRASHAQIDHVFVHADGFEQLRAAIRGNRRNAHL